MSDDALVRLDGVHKKFCRHFKRSLWYGAKDIASDLVGRSGDGSLRRDEFWAVEDVSFELRRGQCLGLVGANGAGKTTILKMLNGLVKPDRGRIQMRGRVGAMIALGAGFNPILSGRENIYVNGAVLGLSRKEVDAKLEEIIDFAEIGDFIDSPVRNYSSGMHVRLGFAIATAMDPDVLLLDEVLAVGDSAFRAKCHRRLGKLLEKAAVIVVSHEAHYIKRLCDHALLLGKGRMISSGHPDTVLAEYVSGHTQSYARAYSLFGDEVSAARIVNASELTRYGGPLEITLSIDLSHSARCDHAHLNIYNVGGSVQAQVVLDDLGGTLTAGRNEISISVDPLFLSKGRFTGSLILWTGGGKRTLATLAHAFSFENDGPVSLGTSYYPPACVSLGRK